MGDDGACVVIVTVDAPVAVLDDMEHHARLGLREFPSWPGFLTGTLHRSHDGTRLVQLLRWRSQAEYERCRDDPRWDDLASTRRFLDHVAAGRATVDARTFSVLARS